MFTWKRKPLPTTSTDETAEPELPKEDPSCTPDLPRTPDSTETKKWEQLYVDHPKDNNEDVCDEEERTPTPWPDESKANIKPPKQVHFPEFPSQIIGTSDSADPESPNEQTPSDYIPCRAGPSKLEDALDNTEDNSHGFSEEAAQTSTPWHNGWSSHSTNAFETDTIARPSRAHFPDEIISKQSSKTYSSQAEVHENYLSEHDLEPTLTGIKHHNGLDKTKELLVNHLMDRMDRIACIKGSRSRTQARSSKDPFQDNRKFYEEEADAFIKLASNLFRIECVSGPSVNDWMIMGLVDTKYLLPEEGKRMPHLNGEWMFLWDPEKDDIMTNGTSIAAETTQPSSQWTKNCSQFPNLIPTAEDWKWWCGEWKKVPGAICEWKPTEEIWPWQRKYWTKSKAVKQDLEFESIRR
ncbi:hypothetical protein NHQ30_006198 [Ciborinia camelliae]|nr:hypothetical protein NHQ30_006198 [Ciborinia camelliae]